MTRIREEEEHSYSTLGPVSAWMVTVFGQVNNLGM